MTARRDKEVGCALDRDISEVDFEVWVRVCKVLTDFCCCFFQPTVRSSSVLFILCPQHVESGTKVDEVSTRVFHGIHGFRDQNLHVTIMSLFS